MMETRAGPCDSPAVVKRMRVMRRMSCCWISRRPRKSGLGVADEHLVRALTLAGRRPGNGDALQHLLLGVDVELDLTVGRHVRRHLEGDADVLALDLRRHGRDLSGDDRRREQEGLVDAT